MVTCPKCHASVPQGMRFCLQCGYSLAPPAAPPAGPAVVADPGEPQPHRQTTTVPLKIAATPVMSPRPGAGSPYPRPSFRDEKVDIDEEALKKSFERHVTQPGVIVCRFCKGPLDISGDFCEQCGAPVSEAAPEGMVLPKPEPPPPPPPRPVAPAPAAPAPVPIKPAQVAPPPPVPRPSPPPAPRPTVHPTPTRGPVPPPPESPAAPPADDQSAGLMGRLKGIFKKS